MYEAFSSEYDHFVNWPGRLAVEMPFLQARLQAIGARRVLDAACGTGRHAIALAQAGFQLSGADLSAGMIARARENARAAGVTAAFEPVGFGDLAAAFGAGAFEAVLCLGNSLPHLLTPELLAAALADFARVLQPGGLLVLQNRNFEAVMSNRQRWMEPQAAREGELEWLFLRFYDFEPEGLLTFNVISLQRQGQGAWNQTIRSTQLRPLFADELQAGLEQAGFVALDCYGDLTGAPFMPASSGNLVVCARLAGGA